MRSVVVLALALSVALGGVGSSSAAGAPVKKKIAGQIVVLSYVQDTTCVTGAELQFPSVKGATGYEITYWDGYYKRDVPASAPPFLDDSKRDKAGQIPDGMLRIGIAGTFGAAPCQNTGPNEAGYKGRFNGKVTVYALLPSNYKPKGSLRVSVSAPAGGAGVGDTVPVTVTVTAGDLPVSGIDLGSGLKAGGSLAEVTKRPSRLSGFSLGANASRTFAFSVKAKEAGAAALTAAASGSTKSGRVSGRGSDTLRISKLGLAVTLSTDPPRFRLDVDDNGKVIPKDVTVTVKVTNTGGSPLQNVSVQAVRPEPVVEGQRLDQLALPKGSLPIELGTLPPKSPATRTFKLTVTGDGRYQLRALALYATPSGGTGKAAVVGGKFEAVVPALYFAPKLQKDNIADRGGVPWVIGGKSWYISAKLRNLSSWRTLCVAPLAPALGQNAAATGLIDILDRNLREIGGPFAGRVKPGGDVSLLMYVDTATAGATRSTVAFDPAAAVIDPGDECNQKTFAGAPKLAKADWKIPAPGADFLVRVDTSVPPAPLRAGGPLINFFGGFTRNVFVDTVRAPLDLIALCRAYWDAEAEFRKQYPLAPAAAFLIFKQAQAITVAADVYASYWKVASAEQRRNALETAGAALKKVSNDYYTNARGFVEEAAEPFMKRLEKAYENGDDAELGYMWGQVAGSAAQQAVLGMFLKTLGGQIVVDSARLERLAAAAGKEWELKEAAKALAAETAAARKIAKKTVPPGTILGLAEKEGVWGIDAASDSAFRRIAKKYDVLIGVRDRAVQSVQKLAKGSVWKHEKLKPKNVSDIDIQWLGFKKNDLAEVRFRTYTDQQVAEITERVRTASTLTAEQKIAILNRFETRLNEAKMVPEIKGYGKAGEINVGFNYRENGIDKASTRNIRKFQLESEKAGTIGGVSAGGEYFTPLQENLELYRLRKGGALPENCRRLLSSVLCTVTGDVDGVYVVQPNGKGIPPSLLVGIYAELAKAGWQHPETLTWINKAHEFLFGAKADILKEVSVGGSAVVEYAPDGLSRATFLNLRQSVLLSSKEYRLRVVGGYADAVTP